MAGEHVNDFYEHINSKMKEFGKQIKAEMGCILCYKITNIAGTDTTACMIIDMANDYGDQSCVCLIGETLEQLSEAHK